jgi:SAM-dependent methyltransferase
LVNDTNKDYRYWEVWDRKHVHDLEYEHWGTAGTPKSRGRHHALNQMVAELVPKGASILEVAPGQGHLYGILKELGNFDDYHGRDTSQDMIDRFKEVFPEVDITQGDAYDLEGEPMVDAVVNVDMLMHLPAELDTPIQQMWSRVKPGGVLLTTMRHPEGDKESWIVERNYISDRNTDEQGKRLVVRAMRRDEFSAILSGLHPSPSVFTEKVYDARTSIWVVVK